MFVDDLYTFTMTGFPNFTDPANPTISCKDDKPQPTPGGKKCCGEQESEMDCQIPDDMAHGPME